MLPYAPDPGGPGTLPPDSPIYGGEEWDTLFANPAHDANEKLTMFIYQNGVRSADPNWDIQVSDLDYAATQLMNTRDLARHALQNYNAVYYNWTLNEANRKQLGLASELAPQPPAILVPLISAWSKNHPDQAL